MEFVEPPDHPPHYAHPCELCEYLGEAEWGGRVFDLYYCKQGHGAETVIARGGNAPHDYSSGLALAAIDPVLREAFERAKRRGFLPVDSVVNEGGLDFEFEES